MGNTTQLGRLEEVAGIFSQLLFPSTFFISFVFASDDVSDDLSVVSIIFYFISLLFTFTFLSRFYKKCVFPLTFAYIVFYMSLVYELWELFSVHEDDDVITKVKHPELAVLAFSCFGIILIQLYVLFIILGKYLGLLECRTKCLIFFFAEVLLIVTASGLIYAPSMTPQHTFLPVSYFLLASVLIIGQIMMIVLYGSLDSAFLGLVDSYRWRTLKSSTRWSFYIYGIFLVLSGIFTSYMGVEYRFEGFQDDMVWAFSLGFYNGVTLLFISGMVGGLISLLIRAIRPTARNHNRRVIVMQDQENENRLNIEFNQGEEFGYLALHENENERRPSNIAEVARRMTQGQFVKQGQNNYECPICLDPFDDMNHVTVHEVCNNGFHTPCLGDWLERGLRTCPLCRVQII